MVDRIPKDMEKLEFAKDWIFNGTVEADIEYNGKILKMHLLDSEEEMEASQRAAARAGNDVDRIFWTRLETVATAITEIDGKEIKINAIRKWLERTPTVIVRHLYQKYLEQLEIPQAEALKQVPN